MLIVICLILFIGYICLKIFYFDRLFIGDLNKKAVLITGAGGGFGKDLTKRCLKAGLTVFAGCHREISAEKLKTEFADFSARLFAFQMDVASDESVQIAQQFITEKLTGRKEELYAIVNNAGVRGNQLFDDMLTIKDYEEVWQVNMFGIVRVTQAFKQMIKRSKGRIIMCGSSASLFSIPGYGPYASSKAAMVAYADVIRHELRAQCVQVSVIQPGSFESGMQDTKNLLEMMDRVWNRNSVDIKEEYGEAFIQQAKEVVLKLQNSVISNDTKWVEDTYFHAIAAQYPKSLYRVGWDTIVLFWPYSFLPVDIQVQFMRFLLFIIGFPLPKAVMNN